MALFMTKSPKVHKKLKILKNLKNSTISEFYCLYFYLWNTGLVTGLGTPPPLTPLKAFGESGAPTSPVRMVVCLQSLGTKGILQPPK